ncbi:MAG TPA: glutamate formimidoyltransferase [Pyrinomonadaceae bacterium]|nr:glutamate formimidoyltransferase [Pyrinomonadaceae bacterium]
MTDWTRIVECVPNFSEGRRPEVVARLVAEIESVAGALVLDTHSDADHNRSVITFVAEPEAAVAASVRVAARAFELIDLREHAGAHPRVGALDVLPFVPVRGVNLADCVQFAHEAGKRIARELDVPVYFYEAAALRPDRVNLEDVRRKGFEQLRAEIGVNPERAPDVGAARVHESAGAVIVGARPFLIAYNINLNTQDVSIARRIARVVRGRDGGLRYLKALGFALPERGLTQVSMNLVRFEQTALHHAFEAVSREAARWGVNVAGSEIVGLIPQAALDRSAEYFLQLENFTPELVLENRIAEAVSRRQKAEGSKQKAEGSRQLRTDERPSATISDQSLMIGEQSPAIVQPSVDSTDLPSAFRLLPSAFSGGGAAAAQAGALAAALGEMVAQLLARKSSGAESEQAGEALQTLAALRVQLTEAVDEDAAAFARVLDARRLPRANDDERRVRAQGLEEALKGAAIVPLEVASLAVQACELLETLAELGDAAWLSDAATGAQLALAAVTAARYNVLVNTAEIEDEEFAAEHRARADDLHARAREIATRVEEMLLDSLQ